MATVGVIVICFRADPRPLFDSIKFSRHQVTWYVFLHGSDPELSATIAKFAQTADVRFHPYGINRGVARSWNEGLIASFADDNDVTLITNDDLFFLDGGFDAFVDFVMLQKERRPDFGIVTLYCSEGAATDNAELAGAACMAVGRAAVETVGYFDQNFWPGYFEDNDYFRRLKLEKLPIVEDPRVLAEHYVSYVIKSDPVLRWLQPERWGRNERYYLKKWGGGAGFEVFQQPFDDPSFDCRIERDVVEAPYGSGYDRTDLATAAVSGSLDGDFAEELADILRRHGTTASRWLEWGAGRHSGVAAAIAWNRGAELFLSLDDRVDVLRRVAAQLPSQKFCHLRCFDAAEPLEATVSSLDYVTYPGSLGVRFDVVTIAGKWRLECAAEAHKLLATDGIVVFRDEAPRQRDRLDDRFELVEEGQQSLVLRRKPLSDKRPTRT